MNESNKTPRVFIVKTTDNNGNPIPGVHEELKRDKARIGWSYEDDLDLRKIENSINNGDQLNETQRGARRCLRFLVAISRGDILIYPHQPERGKFSVVEVTGDYGYSSQEESLDGDFRSFRPCRLKIQQPINIYDSIIPAQLRNRLGRPGRFSEMYHTEPFWGVLHNIDRAGNPEDSTHNEREKRIYEKLYGPLSEELYTEYNQADLSRRFCRELFERMGYDADVQEGPTEAGSDVVVTVGDWLLGEETTFRVGVQVFAYRGDIAPSSLEHKLGQLLSGWEANALDFGALLTTGHCTDKARELIHQHNYNNPKKKVRLIEGDELAARFLRYFPPAILKGTSDLLMRA